MRRACLEKGGNKLHGGQRAQRVKGVGLSSNGCHRVTKPEIYTVFERKAVHRNAYANKLRYGWWLSHRVL